MLRLAVFLLETFFLITVGHLNYQNYPYRIRLTYSEEDLTRYSLFASTKKVTKIKN